MYLARIYPLSFRYYKLVKQVAGYLTRSTKLRQSWTASLDLSGDYIDSCVHVTQHNPCVRAVSSLVLPPSVHTFSEANVATVEELDDIDCEAISFSTTTQTIYRTRGSVACPVLVVEGGICGRVIHA